MNKLYLVLLQIAVVGYVAAGPIAGSTAETHPEDYKIMYGYRLLKAAGDVYSEDLKKVETLRAAIADVNNEWTPLRSSATLETLYPAGDKYILVEMANLVGGVTVAVQYKRGDKYCYEDGTKDKSVWTQLLQQKVVEPCKKIVERLEPAMEPIKEMEYGGSKLEFAGSAGLWIQRFDACEKIIGSTKVYGDLAYEVAEKNNLLK